MIDYGMHLHHWSVGVGVSFSVGFAYVGLGPFYLEFWWGAR